MITNPGVVAYPKDDNEIEVESYPIEPRHRAKISRILAERDNPWLLSDQVRRVSDVLGVQIDAEHYDWCLDPFGVDP